MNDKTTNSFDLHIGIQQIKNEIPNNFKYTRFCSIKPGRLFQSNYFQITDLVAAGTTDGPIVIYTENYTLLSQVCLLCAHTSPVTDIIQMENYFISSSTDGTIIKWSNDDCSFIESFPHIAKKGDILLSHHSNPDYLWVNTVGFSTFLFNAKNGEIIRTFETYGITAVTYLLPYKCFYITQPSFAILKFNSFCIYSDSSIQANDTTRNQPPQSIRHFPINENDHEKYFLSEYGLFRVKEREWGLLSLVTFRETYTRKVKGRIKNDFISNIKWANQTTFCVSTYGSRFVIYFIEVVRDFSTPEIKTIEPISIISPEEAVCNDFLFFSISSNAVSNFDKRFKDAQKLKNEKAQSTITLNSHINGHLTSDGNTVSHESLSESAPSNMNDYRILFSPKPKKIISLKADRTFSMNFFNARPKLYHVPRTSSARVVETDGGNAFYVRNWEKGANSSLKHLSKSRITSIASRESVRKKLEIIVGCNDGTVSFYSENTKKPFATEIVLSSPVIGLAHLPYKYRGILTLLAIGGDGSAALVRNNKVLMRYANSTMKVDAAYYHEVDGCIILHRVDESFIAFKVDEPGPVLFTSLLPKGSTIVWSLNEMQNDSFVYNNCYYKGLADSSKTNCNSELKFDSSLSTNLVRFGTNSWFYASVGISKFINVHNRRYKLFAKFINHLFQQKADDAFPHSRSLNFSSTTACNLSSDSTTNSTSTIVNDSSYCDSDSDTDDDNEVNTLKLNKSSLSLSSSSISFGNKKSSKPPIPLLSKSNPSASNASSSNASSSNTSASNASASILASTPSIYAFSEFPKSQSIQSINDWLSPEKPSINQHRHFVNPLKKIIQGLSLVILGDDKKKATFFYPEYRICGSMAFNLSDENSVTNVIIKTLISGETAEEQNAELIPEFAKLLSCGNEKIETAASNECDLLIGLLTPEISSELVRTIPIESKSIHHMFVLSIVAFNYPNLVPAKKHPALFSFLIRKIMTKESCSSLALSVLIRGFNFWSGMNGKVNLFIELIESFIRTDRPKTIEDIFFKIAIENLDSFFEAIRSTIKKNSYSSQVDSIKKNSYSSQVDSIKKFIDLMSKIAFFKPHVCGIKITSMLVEIAAQFEQTAQLIEDEIGTHSIFFTAVNILNNFIVIGKKDGIVDVYKNFKLVAAEKAFNSPVDYVSIGPNGLFCAAISVSERKAVIFGMPAKSLMSSFHKRSGIETTLEPAANHYKIYWSDPTHCHFTTVD